ncbi:polysaccharide pyruvyl transferase family protein [Vibrio splendidus]
MKRCILVNRKTCSNIGDQAINSSFSIFIEKKFGAEVKSIDYTSRNNEPEPLNIAADYKRKVFRDTIKIFLPLNLIWIFRNFFRLKKEIKSFNPDVIIIGGGQLLLPNRFLVAALCWVLLSKYYNTPILFSNIGVGGKWSKVKSCILKFILNNSNGVNLRDKESYEFVNDLIGFRDTTCLSSDIVLSDKIKRSQPDDNCNRYLLGVPSIDVYNVYNKSLSRENYYNIWLKFIGNNNVNLEKCDLIYTTQEDYNESLLLKEYLSEKYNINLNVLEYSGIDGFNRLLDFEVTVISARMHALILAINNNRSVIVFPISKKLRSFSKQIESTNSDVIEKAHATTYDFLKDYLL